MGTLLVKQGVGRVYLTHSNGQSTQEKTEEHEVSVEEGIERHLQNPHPHADTDAHARHTDLCNTENRDKHPTHKRPQWSTEPPPSSPSNAELTRDFTDSPRCHNRGS